MKNYVIYFAAILLLSACDKQATGPSNPPIVNFFPIGEGNEWSYYVWSNRSGLDMQSTTFFGFETIKIINVDTANDVNDFYQNRFWITAQRYGKTVFESITGDTLKIDFLQTQVDTLEMAMRGTRLVYLRHEEDQYFYFPNYVSELEVMLPDTCIFITLECSEALCGSEKHYSLIKDVGFQHVRVYNLGPDGGTTGSIYFDNLINTQANSQISKSWYCFLLSDDIIKKY
jgi:hypothetical protein